MYLLNYAKEMGFVVLTAMVMKSWVTPDITSCSLGLLSSSLYNIQVSQKTVLSKLKTYAEIHVGLHAKCHHFLL
jgi:hypothetical protein